MTNLDRTLLLWQNIRPRVERAITNSSTFLDGYPSGGTASSSGSGDRTGTLATRHAENDPHGALRRDLEKWVRDGANLIDRLAPSNAAADHLATKASDDCPPGCCESCFRDGGHRTSARTTGSRMCKWCQNLAATLAQDMPPLMLVQRHNRGQRITDRDVRAATGGRG